MTPLSPGSDSPEPRDSQTRRRFQRQKRVDTAPELALRRELHRRGRRYRVDRVVLPGFRRRADLVFTRQQVAVFVDGCYWHACPEHGTLPRTNRNWWDQKLSRNVARDRDTDRRLRDAGWVIVRVWEHENPLDAADRVETVLQQRQRARA